MTVSFSGRLFGVMMKYNTSLVSIIIPTYNRAHSIRRALHSVLHQTYQNIEVIIVDDGSTDDTQAIVKSVGDERVRYIRHDNTLGAAAARNTGIRLASADFIAFQDSDDEWLCEKLELQMGAFESAGKEVGGVYSGFLRIEENRPKYFPASGLGKSGNILTQLLMGNIITTQAVVLRRECLEKVGGFDEEMPRFQDWELFLRVAKYYNFIFIDKPLLVAFHMADSITANDGLYPVAFNLLLEKHMSCFIGHRKILAKNYYVLGTAICKLGNVHEGRSFFSKSLRINQWDVKCWVRWWAALFGRCPYRIISMLIDRACRILT